MSLSKKYAKTDPATNPLHRDPCAFPGCKTPEMAPYPIYGFNLCAEHTRQWGEELNSWDVWQKRIRYWMQKSQTAKAAPVAESARAGT